MLEGVALEIGNGRFPFTTNLKLKTPKKEEGQDEKDGDGAGMCHVAVGFGDR
jgi:hypothetical protein